MDRTTFYDKVSNYLRQTSPEFGDVEIRENDNLFDLGIVTSFTALSMILFVEELLGKSLDLAMLDVETFHTLRRLYDRVAAESPAPLT